MADTFILPSFGFPQIREPKYKGHTYYGTWIWYNIRMRFDFQIDNLQEFSIFKNVTRIHYAGLLVKPSI